MIQDQKQILVNAKPEEVFALIETMPNKFPVYRILETRPLLFLRILFVDGFHPALNLMSIKKPNDIFVMQAGDSLGPFKLTELEKPIRYWFTLKSFFFDCRTGYTLSAYESKTILNFDIISDNPTLMEKLWWFFVKPIHSLMAKKVLKVIKNEVELKI